MVRIRLRRIGSKGKAVYKIIVADQRSPQKGKYLEEVGTYDPHTNPASVNLKEAKISDWISKGAQPSESVYKMVAARVLLFTLIVHQPPLVVLSTSYVNATAAVNAPF